MNFVVILVSMAAFWHRGSSQASHATDRKGKFLGLSNDDLWSDFFDEIDDPLPKPHNSLSVRDHVLQKLQNNQKLQQPQEPILPLAIPEQLVQKLTTTPTPAVSSPSHFLEPMKVYETSTNKNELNPSGVTTHGTPITEGMFLIGGQFGQQTEHPLNMTEENFKVFWSSLGDIIENVPFLPIQVNVPDLLAAMASFFAQRVPLINRITNPNKPRPNTKVPSLPELHYSDLPAETNILEYRQLAPPPAKPKKNKRKTNKKKSNKKRTTENYRIRGSYSSTTEASKNQATSKAWFVKPTDVPIAKSTTETLKLFHHNNSPGLEQVKYKNMPITRKNNRWADRELFNFKHSDISNSPIMILNMPSRPVLMYKFQHEQKTEYPNPNPGQPYHLLSQKH